ncbi:peptidoglycan editing factor PgeF [Salinispirillum marinum]|uniref:Purine nucleoside phosphorylase n=2 Tax=Saccharospirillaceae TaxID=255527 RepID=A0ABV8BKD4_9GAMM
MTIIEGILRPDWHDLPDGVNAVTTTRLGGSSEAPYSSFNLAHHVGDDLPAVQRNRARLADILALPAVPQWLSQVHGIQVMRFLEPEDATLQADAAYTNKPGVPLAIMTADCLPVLIASKDGEELGAAHAGWRGLCDGVIEALAGHFRARPDELTAWLGPAIGPQAFEVGAEVRAAFMAADPKAELCFVERSNGKYLADIYALARQRLTRLGIHSVSGGEYCTVTDKERFFSYRRDGKTGRMATLIWR